MVLINASVASPKESLFISIRVLVPASPPLSRAHHFLLLLFMLRSAWNTKHVGATASDYTALILAALPKPWSPEGPEENPAITRRAL